MQLVKKNTFFIVIQVMMSQLFQLNELLNNVRVNEESAFLKQ